MKKCKCFKKICALLFKEAPDLHMFFEPPISINSKENQDKTGYKIHKYDKLPKINNTIVKMSQIRVIA